MSNNILELLDYRSSITRKIYPIEQIYIIGNSSVLFYMKSFYRRCML